MNRYTKTVSSCLECEHCDIYLCFDREGKEAWCRHKPERLISTGWDRQQLPIPDWCPILIKDDLDDAFKNAGIGSIEKFIEKSEGLLKNQSDEYAELVRILFSKGLAYNQVKWERDIAISQLNELGVNFGEKINKDGGKNGGD